MVFVDIGISIGAAFGHRWVAIPAVASPRRLRELFESEFYFLVYVQLLIN